MVLSECRVYSMHCARSCRVCIVFEKVPGAHTHALTRAIHARTRVLTRAHAL